MIVRLITRFLGGPWRLRERCLSAPQGPGRRLLVALYKARLQLDGAWISLEADIASAPCFPHGMAGVFISGGVTIGHNSVIFQQVTIGSNTLADATRLGAPLIGDCCYIGAGAKIIGGIAIGHHVRIGANAVVHRDTPDNCVVTNGPQQTRELGAPPDNRFIHRYHGRWVCHADGRRMPIEDASLLRRLDAGFTMDRTAGGSRPPQSDAR